MRGLGLRLGAGGPGPGLGLGLGLVAPRLLHQRAEGGVQRRAGLSGQRRRQRVEVAVHEREAAELLLRTRRDNLRRSPPHLRFPTGATRKLCTAPSRIFS